MAAFTTVSHGTGDPARPAALRVLLASDFLIKYTAALAQGVLESGAAVTLLTRDHDLEFGGAQGAMRAHVRDRLADSAGHLELMGRIRDPAALMAVRRTRQVVRRFEPQVVHLQDAILTDPRLIIAARARSGRYALTVHDPTRHPGGNRPRARFELVRKALIKRAGLIFVHAEALREELIERHRTRAPIVVVPHGVDEPSVKPLPATPSLLFFGRLMSYKGLDTLLDAMPSVWSSNPDVRLTVAGEGDVPRHSLLGDDRVSVLNSHVPEEEVAGLYERSTCVVLPYRQASQSGVGSLARTYGRAMVVTEVGGLPDLVRDGAGVTVPPEDPRALAAAISEVLGTPGLAETMGRAGAKSAREGASWPHVGRLTLEAYRCHLRL